MMERNESEFGSRAYFFNNMYLSSIQQGIQAAHVITNMFMKYSHSPEDTNTKMLMDWAMNHETIVILNAGYSSELIDLTLFFNMPENRYPWALFKESAEALNCATTSVGIVLPYEIYEGAKHIENPRVGRQVLVDDTMVMYLDGRDMPAHYSSWEDELMRKMNKYSLAR